MGRRAITLAASILASFMLGLVVGAASQQAVRPFTITTMTATVTITVEALKTVTEIAYTLQPGLEVRPVVANSSFKLDAKKKELTLTFDVKNEGPLPAKLSCERVYVKGPGIEGIWPAPRLFPCFASGIVVIFPIGTDILKGFDTVRYSASVSLDRKPPIMDPDQVKPGLTYTVTVEYDPYPFDGGWVSLTFEVTLRSA